MKLYSECIARLIGSLLVAAFVCLLPSFSAADGSGYSLAQMNNASADDTRQSILILPLDQQPSAANLAFDLGDSAKQKLELRLSRPLTLDIASSLQKSSAGLGSIFLNNTLNLGIGNDLDITASLGAGKTPSSFQSLGSIHCQNGVLTQGSYRASDCHFINQANILQQDQIAMGLRYSHNNLSSAIGMFRQSANLNPSNNLGQAAQPTSALMAAGLLLPPQNNPLLSNMNTDQPVSYIKSEASGIGVEFQVGLATDRAGDVKLGLQLTRVLGATYEAGPLNSSGLQRWSIAKPFDAAKMNLDWNKGNFSGGIEGFYRNQVQFLNRNDLQSIATFDVNFTWHAPWNAKLSVGTTNVLNAGSKDFGKPDKNMQDPFETIYGRIPYVRYQQDL